MPPNVEPGRILNQRMELTHGVKAARAVFRRSDVPRGRANEGAHSRHPPPRGSVPSARPRTHATPLSDRVQSSFTLADLVVPSSIPDDRVDPIRDPVPPVVHGPSATGFGLLLRMWIGGGCDRRRRLFHGGRLWLLDRLDEDGSTLCADVHGLASSCIGCCPPSYRRTRGS